VRSTEPDFVSAYDIGDFVYFFFREAAVEYINCGKVHLRHTSEHSLLSLSLLEKYIQVGKSGFYEIQHRCSAS